MSYRYKITTKYCWYDNASMIVKMYFIQGIPFTFDELSPPKSSNLEIIALADKEKDYDAEYLYSSSFYLIDEEAHPCLFDLELENPEDMPPDIEYEYKRE